MKNSTYKLLQPFIMLHIIVVAGILGYMIIEGASFSDAIYMTTITITTVGYAETFPLSSAGRAFTMFLLITSWLTYAFVITRITQFVISGELNQYFKNRKLMRDISRLQDHVIVCGYGRNGNQAANILTAHNVPFIVVEKDEHLVQRVDAEGNGIIRLEGDATDDDVLRAAGVERARALITTLPLDAQNVFIVLSARSLNPGLKIISRASEATSVAKLKKAGADNVIMPDFIGGTHMATLISKPDVVEFIDFLSGEQGHSIHMESVSFNDLPLSLKDKSLHDVMGWKKTGVNCIGIKDKEGNFLINPPEDTYITPGMRVIVLGTIEQIREMKGNLQS
ncbi:MAG: potassium channel protein [Sphingobacteriales bacterium]|nr:potassium channel protein [Sphingobacteriales bacterium]